MADVRLLVLRALYSAPEWARLSRLLLFAALFLAVQLLLGWRRRTGAGRLPSPRLLLLIGLLAALALIDINGYQGAAARSAHLQIARSAPVRVTYGDEALAPVIQVFTAPGCGPCKSLEQHLQAVIGQGYAVQYIPSSLSGADWGLINAAMCAADRKAGFEWLFGIAPATPPPNAPTGCRSGVIGNQAVLRQLSGSLVFPTLVMPDGLLLIGAPSDSSLQSYLHLAAPLPAQANGGHPF